MEGGFESFNPRTPDSIFSDFSGRRAGIIKALTTEARKFHQECVPEKENLCLFGLPDETWEVNQPAEDVPTELPEPLLGINFARDEMNERNWLSLVAAHSDSWLIALAFYYGARFGFDKQAREQLFDMINSLPTIYEVVLENNKKQLKEEKDANSNGKKKSVSKTSNQPTSNANASKVVPPKNQGTTITNKIKETKQTSCGVCRKRYTNDGFWICCDVCIKWYHGNCVEVTPDMAEKMRHYKCPACSNNKGAGK